MFHGFEETIVRARRARHRLLRRLAKLLLAKLARRMHRLFGTPTAAAGAASLRAKAAGIFPPAPGGARARLALGSQDRPGC